VVAALLVLLTGCARPQGAQTTPTPTPSPTPVAQHAPLTIALPVFHSGEIGVVYAPVKLSATGGAAPYTWSVSVGALPGGVALSTDGIVSGTPTQNGYFTFSVQVVDAGSNDTAGLPANIPIVPRLTASLVPGCATECTVELGCMTVCGTFGQVSGGVAPITYTLTGGVLPAGTALSGLTLNGTFIGLPGRLQFAIQVTDGFGVTATITPKYNLIPHISLASGSCVGIFTACSMKLQISGGLPGGTPSVKLAAVGPQTIRGCWSPTPMPLPSGYTLSVGGGYVTVFVPRPGNGYGGIWTLVLTDQALCAAGTYCVAPAAMASIGIQCT
jgi:hypothetical protein